MNNGLDDHDDDQLVELVLQGDGDAFSLLFRRYDPLIRRVILRIVFHQQDMEDVAGSTWDKAWETLATLRDRSRFKPWLTTIARNKAVDHLRSLPPDYLRKKGRREEGSNEEDEELVDSEDVEDQVTTQIIFEEARKAAFKRMRPEQRKCFTYRVQGWTIESIAVKLKLSDGTVKTYISGAYRILREEFRKRLDGDQKNE